MAWPCVAHIKNPFFEGRCALMVGPNNGTRSCQYKLVYRTGQIIITTDTHGRPGLHICNSGAPILRLRLAAGGRIHRVWVQPGSLPGSSAATS
jgi:hypothetical protein